MGYRGQHLSCGRQGWIKAERRVQIPRQRITQDGKTGTDKAECQQASGRSGWEFHGKGG
jgi:hypothetical protein